MLCDYKTTKVPDFVERVGRQRETIALHFVLNAKPMARMMPIAIAIPAAMIGSYSRANSNAM